MVIARRASKQGTNGVAEGAAALGAAGPFFLPTRPSFFLVLATLTLILRVVCFESLAKGIFVTCPELLATRIFNGLHKILQKISNLFYLILDQRYWKGLRKFLIIVHLL
jgi:hypothetical protein